MTAFSLSSAVMAMLFVRPVELPPWMRLWMFLPLALCIAVVYRATRAHSAAELPRTAVVTFLNIVLGMIAIAITAYALHEFVLRFF